MRVTVQSKGQTSFVYRKNPDERRGGCRKGAGRPPKIGRRNVPHRKRGKHHEGWPVLVTLRAVGYLPSLREQLVLRLVKNLLFVQAQRLGTDFRVAHFSIRTDHLHLIVEAHNGALTKGIRSFIISFARRLNRLLQRQGRVWDDRYHRRDLRSPRAVHAALGYVLNNDLKHGHRKPAAFGCATVVDKFSSASLLDARDGWCAPVLCHNYAVPWPDNMRPRTWGLREGWLLHGPLDPRRKPGPP